MDESSCAIVIGPRPGSPAGDTLKAYPETLGHKGGKITFLPVRLGTDASMGKWCDGGAIVINLFNYPSRYVPYLSGNTAKWSGHIALNCKILCCSL